MGVRESGEGRQGKQGMKERGGKTERKRNIFTFPKCSLQLILARDIHDLASADSTNY